MSSSPSAAAGPPPQVPPPSLGKPTIASIPGLNDANPTSSSAVASGPPDPSTTVARLSSPWERDRSRSSCASCGSDFHLLNRRHHCRLCGRIFCHDCSDRRCLIPPSAIVLTPPGGKRDGGFSGTMAGEGRFGFEDRNDEEEDMVTYLRSTQPSPGPDAASGADGGGGGDTLLYGRGLERRALLAREPLRVCAPCHDRLAPLQDELRSTNSNAVRYNAVDPSDPIRRVSNSPLAFTLGHEVRKASYALGNLLPLPRRMGAFVGSGSDLDYGYGAGGPRRNDDDCADVCSGINPTFGDLDGVRIPARLLEKARGVAVITAARGGFGLAGIEFGTGLVVSRLDAGPCGEGTGGGVGRDGGGMEWSAPSAVGLVGVSWGALLGAQVTDHVFLLMTDGAVDLLSSDTASIQLGADVAVAVGPLGRSIEADVGASVPSEEGYGHASSSGGGLAVAPIYSYSLSKGLYVGASLDGRAIVSRRRVNERFYGRAVSASELLNGAVPPPPAAQPLYDALRRCHVYASSSLPSRGLSGWDGDRGGGTSQYGRGLQAAPSDVSSSSSFRVPLEGGWPIR